MKIIQLKIKTKKNMKSKVKIKVIKKYAVKTSEIPVVIEQNLKQNAGREIASTISDWISEFKHRRRRETKQIRFLFGK